MHQYFINQYAWLDHTMLSRYAVMGVDRHTHVWRSCMCLRFGQYAAYSWKRIASCCCFVSLASLLCHDTDVEFERLFIVQAEYSSHRYILDVARWWVQGVDMGGLQMWACLYYTVPPPAYKVTSTIDYPTSWQGWTKSCLSFTCSLVERVGQTCIAYSGLELENAS